MIFCYGRILEHPYYGTSVIIGTSLLWYLYELLEAFRRVSCKSNQEKSCIFIPRNLPNGNCSQVKKKILVTISKDKILENSVNAHIRILYTYICMYYMYICVCIYYIYTYIMLHQPDIIFHSLKIITEIKPISRHRGEFD